MVQLYIFMREFFRRNKLNILFIEVVFFVLSLPGCFPKQSLYKNFSAKNQIAPIFIQMPTSNNVYENIVPIVYDLTIEHFELVGYKISCQKSNAYTLNIIIKSFDPVQKYVSPDVLLFHSTIRLELECQLFNLNQSVVASKVFYFYALMSKSKDPVGSGDFLDFEYRRLLKKSLPKVEQYFRKYLVEKCQ